MDIERTAAVIRARTGTESVDFGFTMVRRWWRPIYGGLLLTMAPVVSVIIVLGQGSFFWPLFFIWLLKPVFERLPLLVISRGFFGQDLTTLGAIRATGLASFKHFLNLVFMRRLSPLRSYVAPVDELERPEPLLRPSRVAVLTRQQGGTAFFLLLASLLFELYLYCSVFALVLMFLPESLLQNFDFILDLFLEGETPVWTGLVSGLAYALALAIMMPFYVAGGFALYINRRVQLEGWDIDLGFRRIAKRLNRSSAALIVALLLGSVVAAGTVRAAPSGAVRAGAASAATEDARAIAREVVAHRDFGGTEVGTEWRLKSRSAKEKTGSESNETKDLSTTTIVAPPGIGGVLMVLMVVLALAVVIGLLVALRRGTGETAADEGTAAEVQPTTLFGLDIRSDSLPKDLIAAARRAWAAGDQREALSILYRGALLHVIGDLGVTIPLSATEGECVSLVAATAKTLTAEVSTSSYAAGAMASSRELTMPSARRPSANLPGDFDLLTRAWQLTAYGQRPPNDAGFADLVRRWQEHLVVSELGHG